MVRTAFGLVILTTVLLIALPALAQEETIVIAVDGVRRGEEGSITTVAAHAVDPSMVALACTGTAETANNASEHPNNDFILTSGTSSTVIPDWEREAGAVVSTTMSLVLGETITVELRLGPRGVSSGAVLITLSCVQPEPPTTTTTTTTSTPLPTTTTTAAPPPIVTTTQPPPLVTTTSPPAATTTTERPPEGGVSAGGGAMSASRSDADLWFGLGAIAMAAAVLLASLARARQREDQL